MKRMSLQENAMQLQANRGSCYHSESLVSVSQLTQMTHYFLKRKTRQQFEKQRFLGIKWELAQVLALFCRQ